MKLLFDQNISFRIVPKAIPFFPDSSHVRALGLENNSDRQIWEYAKSNHFAIVTFDSDFSVLSTIFGTPPKIIWLKIGNSTTENVLNYLQRHFETIRDFLLNPEFDKVACLELE